jgi:predicted alpha/beta superfamily hydrolase
MTFLKTTAFIIFFIGIFIQGECQDYPDDFFNSQKQTIKSKILGQERLLFIYLPFEYNKNPEQKFPVYYVADAPATSNLFFDMMRLHGIVNTVPKCIVVGLSSDGRNHNLHPDKGAGDYLRFIKTEVIPFIEKSYRTAHFRGLAGHSLSGDFTLFALLHEPPLFNAYIAGSPGPPEPILKMVKNSDKKIQSPDQYTFIFSSIGSQEVTTVDNFRKLESALSEKMGKNIEFHFRVNNEEDHISNIAVNFQQAIKTLYHDWKFQLPEQFDKPAGQLIKDHYNKLERKFGYEIPIGEWEVFFPVMDQLAKQGDFKNAISVLNYCIKMYPKSDQAHAFLAKAYFDTGNMEEGKKHLEKALELNPYNQYAIRIRKMLENRK